MLRVTIGAASNVLFINPASVVYVRPRYGKDVHAKRGSRQGDLVGSWVGVFIGDKVEWQPVLERCEDLVSALSPSAEVLR